MRKLLVCLFVLFSVHCLAAVTPTVFQRFLKEYSESKKQGGFSWSEIAYAIEMDYDEIAFYCLEKLPLRQVDYKCFDVQMRNIFCRCVIKNKMEILIAICNKYPEIIPNGSEYCINLSKIGNSKVQERQILNIAIGCQNSLEWVKLLADLGVDLNKCEDYFVFPSVVSKSHKRTLLQESIFKNKLDVVAFLLERGIDPDTGLFMAIVDSRNLEALILLLNYGADPYAYNGSILKEAIELEDDEIVDILTSAFITQQEI